MADFVVECDFLKIAEKAHNRASGGALQKRSSMYTSTEIVQGMPLYALNNSIFTPPPI
ncbi:MAG: hypothetical protein FWG98_14885 [Candidatus Cloacimonetes bacterium]|nr:hypothetical protein [Candidatus Cloacimonadota bacterium]